MAQGVPQFFSVFFGAMVLKLGDAAISLVLITGLYWLLPKSLRYDTEALKQENKTSLIK